jgi:hypothetical protein
MIPVHERLGSLFRILEILVRMRMVGFVDWITDPNLDADPALFVSAFQDVKNYPFRSRIQG